MFFNITQKQCSKCKELKSQSEFYKGRYECKACTDKASRKYQASHREKTRAYDKKRYSKERDRRTKNAREWKKQNPDKVLRYSRTSGKEWHTQNKERANEMQRKRYLVNPIKNLLASLRWKKEHPEENRQLVRHRQAKKREAEGKITAKEWIDLCNKYGNKCLCCKRTDVKLTLDHVLPLKLGGKNIISNAQPLCGSCNSSKGARHIDYR